MLMQTQGYEEIEVIRGSGRSGPGRERKNSRRNYMFDKLEDFADTV